MGGDAVTGWHVAALALGVYAAGLWVVMRVVWLGARADQRKDGWK